MVARDLEAGSRCTNEADENDGAVLVKAMCGDSPVGLELDPKREESARRAIRIFSAERTLSSVGEPVGPTACCIVLALCASRGNSPACAAAALDGGVVWLSELMALTIGEYCEIGLAPLNAPVGVDGLGGANLVWPA